jgi:hypothetical protein
MILKVVKYGHPALRKKGERVRAITPAIKELIANMFETMYAAHGIGLSGDTDEDGVYRRGKCGGAVHGAAAGEHAES